MLGKLIKNDFKASAHSMLGIYLIAFAVYAAAAIAYTSDQNNATTIQIILTAVLILFSFAILVIPIFQLLSYFNKSLYSNQGYLSYTLPVKSESLLFSKAIVSFAWIVVAYAFFVSSYVLMFTNFVGKLDPEIKAMLGEIYDMINGPEKEVLIKFLVAILAVVLFEIIFLISQIFFAITLSNVKPFNGFGAFGGIILFIVLFLVMNSINNELLQNFPLSLRIRASGVSIVNLPMTGVKVPDSVLIGIAGFIFQFVAMIGMFIGTDYLMKKKVNIK